MHVFSRADLQNSKLQPLILLIFLRENAIFYKIGIFKKNPKNLRKIFPKPSRNPPKILPKSMKNRKKSIKKAMMTPGAPKMRKKCEKLRKNAKNEQIHFSILILKKYKKIKQ